MMPNIGDDQLLIKIDYTYSFGTKNKLNIMKNKIKK